MGRLLVIRGSRQRMARHVSTMKVSRHRGVCSCTTSLSCAGRTRQHPSVTMLSRYLLNARSYVPGMATHRRTSISTLQFPPDPWSFRQQSPPSPNRFALYRSNIVRQRQSRHLEHSRKSHFRGCVCPLCACSSDGRDESYRHSRHLEHLLKSHFRACACSLRASTLLCNGNACKALYRVVSWNIPPMPQVRASIRFTREPRACSFLLQCEQGVR